MTEIIDARGLACPGPVLRTKKALEENPRPIRVLVDNSTARDNVSRFARSRGCKVAISDEDYGFCIEITPSCEAAEPTARSSVIVISGDFMGKGEEQLGRLLMKAFLNALAEGSTTPDKILLFNTGVKLAAGEAETAENLKRLEEMGTEILVCGTCLDYFNLKDKLLVGKVSNMFEILSSMQEAESCIAI
jgi:selenium metabolism protein YedF